MRLHIPSLPHTCTTAEYSWCAYTQKVKKFCDMMMDQGHEVYLYAGVENEARCTEYLAVTDEKYLDGFIPEFNPDNRIFKRFNDKSIMLIKDRIEQHDIICLIGGRAQLPIKEAFPNHIVCEFGIGYSGIIPDTHHVFESFAWMHSVYGSQINDAHDLNGRFYDTVIPNYFDKCEFPSKYMSNDRNYLLYVGRLIERKGLQIVLEVAERTGLPLHIAGSGNYPLPNWVEYHGVVGPQERSKLMGGAIALLAPTLYIEPFGGVTIESLFMGTPAITTNWGAFAENISPKWRCNSIASFCNAVAEAQQLTSLHRTIFRTETIQRFSLAAIGPEYDKYFRHLQTLFGQGFYEVPSA
jgi:glycosyltransferase involved in cell wall biosynthesis